MELPEPVRAAIDEAGRLAFVLASVKRGPVRAVEVGPDGDIETAIDRVTVVFSRPDQNDIPASWVLRDGNWVYAVGVELP
jgi:hypothetical protein